MSEQVEDRPALVKVRGLTKRFPAARNWWGRTTASVHAVENVAFDVFGQETLGLVGESGCGKSTVGRLVLRLLQPSAGQVWFEDQELTPLSPRQLRPLRRRFQIVFQDPYSSLNPRMTVRATIAEALKIHGVAVDPAEQTERVASLLRRVGLRAEHMRRYPHEFSGGQRQRIGIARALAVEPRFVVADEPVSALDVSIQAQIVNLLMDLQAEFGLSYLFIAHDLNVIRLMSHRVAVMYLGHIVELASAQFIYEAPLHPYSRALLSAVPVPKPGAHSRRVVLRGDVPSPVNPPTGCAFHPRCPIAKKGLCDREEPELRELRPGHWVACHLAE